MTREKIEEIKKSLESISPWPWHLAPEQCGIDGQGVYCSSLGLVAEVGDPYPRGDNNPEYNMPFIRSAPEVISELLAEIKRLSNLLDDATADLVDLEKPAGEEDMRLALLGSDEAIKRILSATKKTRTDHYKRKENLANWKWLTEEVQNAVDSGDIEQSDGVWLDLVIAIQQHGYKEDN